jgi:hypothetical protein
MFESDDTSEEGRRRVDVHMCIILWCRLLMVKKWRLFYLLKYYPNAGGRFTVGKHKIVKQLSYQKRMKLPLSAESHASQETEKLAHKSIIKFLFFFSSDEILDVFSLRIFILYNIILGVISSSKRSSNRTVENHSDHANDHNQNVSS